VGTAILGLNPAVGMEVFTLFSLLKYVNILTYGENKKIRTPKYDMVPY